VSRQGTVFHRGTGLFSPHWNVSRAGFAYNVAQIRRSSFDSPDRFVPGEVAAIAGPSVGVWGHWLVDFLPRLCALHLAGYDLWKLRYILPKATPRFAVELLALPGIGAAALEWYDETSNHPNFIQSGIAESLDQEVGYVLAETPFEAIRQRFAMAPDDVNRALDWMDVRMQQARA